MQNKRKASLVAIFSMVLSIFVAIPTSSRAVVFGTEIPNASEVAPWVAQIWYSETANSQPEFICSGSLIKADIILTAAHCNFDKGFYWVRLKSDTMDSDQPLREVAGVWRNERYSPKTITNDMGLLKLTEPVTDVRPITLPTSAMSAKILALKKFQILGWGVDQNNVLAKFLRVATLENQDAAARRAYGNSYNQATMLGVGHYISAERVYAGGCHGDSGGPLLGNIGGTNYLVGLTSWGSAQGCDKGKPTIFTRLSYYLSDITRGIGVVTKSASSYNRAAPRNTQKAAIQGSARVGTTLTCTPGVWSANTSNISLRWTSPGRISGNTSPSVVVTPADAGQTFTCQVTGQSSSATLVINDSKQIPVAPVSLSVPIITGASSSAPPKVGTSLTCSGSTWGSGMESTSSPIWYVGDNYSSSQLGSATNQVGQGNSLVLTKEIILAAQNHSILCAITASGAGGTTLAIANYRMPQLGTPSPTVNLVGYDGSSAPYIGQTSDCQVSEPDQYESITYEWSARPDRSTVSSTILGTSARFVFTKENIAQVKLKYLTCKVTATNLIASGSATQYIYVKEPTAPDPVSAQITGITSSSTANSGTATCLGRTPIAGEEVTFTWGSGAPGANPTIITTLGTGPTLAFNQAVFDEVAGQALVCKISIKNIIGEVTSSTGISITAPEIQMFTKNGHYYKWVAQKVSWTEARRIALSLEYNGQKGYLATPTTLDEYNFIRKKSGFTNSFWLGGTDAENEGCWKWADGPEANVAFFAKPNATNCSVNASMNFTNWDNGEPNNFNDKENAVHAYPNNGLWNDGPNDDPTGAWAYAPTGFVVEFGGTVNPLALLPGTDGAASKISISSPANGAITNGRINVIAPITYDRYFGTIPSRIGIKLTGPAGFTAGSYNPAITSANLFNVVRYSSTSPSAVFGSVTADYSWTGQTTNLATFSIDGSSLPNGSYTMQLLADSGGLIQTSNTVTFQVVATISGLSAVPVANSSTSIQLNWVAPTATTGLDNYLVEYTTDGSNWSRYDHIPSTAAGIVVSGLTSATSYTFRVTPSFNGVADPRATVTSTSAQTNAQQVLNLASITSLASWATAGDPGAWNPIATGGKLRVIPSTGGKGGAIYKAARFDTYKGLDVTFRLNYNTGSTQPGDGVTFVIADGGNSTLVSAPNTGGTWTGWGGGNVGYNGDSPAAQFQGGLIDFQFMLNGGNTLRVFGKTGTSAVLNQLNTATVTTMYGKDTYVRVVIDPISVPTASRSYRVYVSATPTFGAPAASGLLSTAGIDWVDPSSGAFIGFTGATGANMVNGDVDQISVLGALK